VSPPQRKGVVVG